MPTFFVFVDNNLHFTNYMTGSHILYGIEIYPGHTKDVSVIDTKFLTRLGVISPIFPQFVCLVAATRILSVRTTIQGRRIVVSYLRD